MKLEMFFISIDSGLGHEKMVCAFFTSMLYVNNIY